MRAFRTSRVVTFAVAATASAYQLASPLRTRGLRACSPLMSDSDFDGVAPKSIFMFPGQGAQAIGMGAEAAAEVPAAAELYKKASEILGYDLLAIDDKAKLDTTAVSQPAIFVASMAAVEKLRASEGGAEKIDAANMAMGLSLGEYTALAFAGAISFEDGVKITKARGEAMQAASEAASSGMASVIGLDSDKVAELCAAASEAAGGSKVGIANFLCPGNYAVSGSMDAVEKVMEMAKPEFKAVSARPRREAETRARRRPRLDRAAWLTRAPASRPLFSFAAHGRQACGRGRLPHRFHVAGGERAWRAWHALCMARTVHGTHGARARAAPAHAHTPEAAVRGRRMPARRAGRWASSRRS